MALERGGRAIADGEFVAELELVFFRMFPIDLLQARCVCREWRRTIDDLGFRERYTHLHRLIPHLCLQAGRSLFLKPAEEPHAQWRLFQTLPAGVELVSANRGLLCLAKFAEHLHLPTAIFVWRFSDLHSSPARVPPPPIEMLSRELEFFHFSVPMVFHSRRSSSDGKAGRSSARGGQELEFFHVAYYDEGSGAFWLYNSAQGKWCMGSPSPEPESLMESCGLYPVLDHGLILVCSKHSWTLATYDVWGDSWCVLELPQYLGEEWFILQLEQGAVVVSQDNFHEDSDEEDDDRDGVMIVQHLGEKWVIDSRVAESSDFRMLTCTDGRNSIWVITDIILHYDVASRVWSEVETPSDILFRYLEMAWFSC